MSSRPRIVSLLPSSTEIVAALGFADSLVGRSHECDYPAGVERLPVCTAPRFSVEGSSREIDDRVRGLVRDALSVYEVDAARLAELRPDVVVTQSQCEVCAVALPEVERAVADAVGGSVRVVSLEASSLEGVWADIRRVAEALEAEDAGEHLVRRLRARVDAIASEARSAKSRPRVLCLEWLDPPMVAGNWMPELIELAGGRSVPAGGETDSGGEVSKSQWTDWQAIEEAAPEVVLVAPCGFDMARTAEEISLLTAAPAWSALPAVRDGRAYVVDGNQYFNRPGPRLVESLEIASEILHPELFAFGHERKGWRSIERASRAR